MVASVISVISINVGTYSNSRDVDYVYKNIAAKDTISCNGLISRALAIGGAFFSLLGSYTILGGCEIDRKALLYCNSSPNQAHILM